MIFDNDECMSYDSNAKILYLTHPISGIKYRIYSFDKSCKIEINNDNIWEECNNFSWDIPIYENGTSLDSHVSYYLSNFPEEIKNYIIDYPFDQIYLLRICSQSDRALQLMEQSKNLLWYISKPIFNLHMNNDEVHNILGKKRRDLIGIDGTLNEDWTVRLLERIGCPNFYIIEPQKIFKLITNNYNIISTLRHNKNVNWDILKCAFDNSDLFNIKYVKNIFINAKNVYEINMYLGYEIQLIKDIKRLGISLNINNVESIIAEYTSLKGLKKLHDSWTEKLIAITYEKRNDIKFPDPPFIGNDYIEPITNYLELCREGKEMHNCVASYDHLIRRGNCYIYRVIAPERATLEIKRRLNHKYWRLSQICTYCNRNVLPETMEYVQKWIQSENLKLNNASEVASTY